MGRQTNTLGIGLQTDIFLGSSVTVSCGKHLLKYKEQTKYKEQGNIFEHLLSTFFLFVLNDTCHQL